MAVNRYCLAGQGLQRNTLLHAVALPWAFSHSPLLTDHQLPQTIHRKQRHRRPSGTGHATPNGYAPPKSTDHLALYHPCRPPPGATSPEETPLPVHTLTAHVHHASAKTKATTRSRYRDRVAAMRYAIVIGLPLAQQEPVWPRPRLGSRKRGGGAATPYCYSWSLCVNNGNCCCFVILVYRG